MPRSGGAGKQRARGALVFAVLIGATAAVAWPQVSSASEPHSTPSPTPVRLPAGIGRQEWPLAVLQAGVLWEHSQGQGIKVAVVDTGIDSAIPDLKGAVSEGVPHAPAVKDSHGTEIAAIIAGRGASKMAGLAPRAQVIDVPIAGRVEDITPQAIASGIRTAVKDGAQVINVSVGVPNDPGNVIQHAAMDAWSHHALVVASGGPGNANTYPAVAADVTAVGAEKQNLRAAAALTAGDGPHDLYAPGAGVYSVNAEGAEVSGLSGTDFAAAYVSAAAALLWAANPGLPARSMSQFRAELLNKTSPGNPGLLDPLPVLQHSPYLNIQPPWPVPPSPTPTPTPPEPTHTTVPPTAPAPAPTVGTTNSGSFSWSLFLGLLGGAGLLAFAARLGFVYFRWRGDPPVVDFNMRHDWPVN
jgi:subtilisin family serine protease